MLATQLFPYIFLPSEKEAANQSQRIFHGRGHAYPDLEFINIDLYSKLLIITLYKEVELDQLSELALKIKEALPYIESIQAQKRYERHGEFVVLYPQSGELVEHWQAVELGLNYHLSFGRQRNTGIFLDIANGRSWLKENSADRKVLNLFSYTCAFSVAALAGGAELVVNVDMSKASLSQGRENHKLNNQDLSKVKFEGVDIFKSFGRLKKHGPYDVLVCDPPSFQKGSVDIKRDYAKIIRRIPQLMNPNGDVMLCLNSPDLSEEFLLQQVEEHCPECEYQLKIENPEVFREAQEGKGLKVLLFKYLP